MSLLSHKIRHYMRKAVTLGQKGHAHPFQWNEKLERPEICMSKTGRFIWLVHTGLGTMYFSFVLIQSLRVNFAPNSNSDPNSNSSNVIKIYMRFVVVYRTLLIMSQLANVVSRDEFCGFFYRFSMLMTEFQGDLDKLGDEDKTWNRNGEKKGEKSFIPKFHEIFLDVVWYNTFVVLFGVILLAVTRPEMPEFLSSVLTPLAEENKTLQLITRIFSILFQIYLEYLYASNDFLWIVPSFVSIFCGIAVLRQIKALVFTSTRKNDPLPISKEKVQKIMRMYREMEILQKSVQDTFGPLVFPLVKVISISGTILCTYGGLKTGGFLAGLLGFLAIFVFSALVMLMETLAEFHRNSQEILHRLRSPQLQKSMTVYERKMLRSFNLIQVKIQMGSSYVIDKLCVVTVIKIVADSTVNFLLANS